MADQEMKEELTRKLEEHLGRFYTPPCNYVLVQVDPLLKMCHENYGGNIHQFEQKFLIPAAGLLERLLANRLHITLEDPQKQIYVLLHLTEPGAKGTTQQDYKMTPGEVVIWVGKTNPSTLSMKYTRYVTERDGTPLPEPKYEETRMKIKETDIPRCLTKGYFSELRRELKEKGAERYSIAMRLFVAYNTTTKTMKSIDYDDVLVHHRRRQRAPKLRERTGSGIQESCDDPVASSTEAQALRQALSPYRNHRTGAGQGSDHEEYRSPSPTGTGASSTQPLTDSSEDEESPINGVTANGITATHEESKGRPRSDGSEPEACVTLKKPRDDYIDQEKAVGPNTNHGEEVKSPVATKMDDYI